MKPIALLVIALCSSATMLAQQNESKIEASNPNAFYNRVDFSTGLILAGADRADLEGWLFELRGDLSLNDRFRLRFAVPLSNYYGLFDGHFFHGTSIDADFKLHKGDGLLRSGVISAGITSPLISERGYGYNNNWAFAHELRLKYQADLDVMDQLHLYPSVAVYQRRGANGGQVPVNQNGDLIFPDLIQPGVRIGTLISYDFHPRHFFQLNANFDTGNFQLRGDGFDESANDDNHTNIWNIDLRYQFAFNPHSQIYFSTAFMQDDFTSGPSTNTYRELTIALGYTYLM